MLTVTPFPQRSRVSHFVLSAGARLFEDLASSRQRLPRRLQGPRMHSWASAPAKTFTWRNERAKVTEKPPAPPPSKRFLEPSSKDLKGAVVDWGSPSKKDLLANPEISPGPPNGGFSFEFARSRPFLLRRASHARGASPAMTSAAQGAGVSRSKSKASASPTTRLRSRKASSRVLGGRRLLGGRWDGRKNGEDKVGRTRWGGEGGEGGEGGGSGEAGEGPKRAQQGGMVGKIAI